MRVLLRPRAAGLVALCVFLSLGGGGLGCGDGLAQELASYSAGVAELAAPSTRPRPYPDPVLDLPRRRSRRLVTEEARIGVFDFLSLQGCRLGELAGFRNSSMGKVLTDSRLLVYELQVLEAGAGCLPGLDEPRRTRLQTLLDTKRAQLDRYVWNAVWGASEVEGYLSTGLGPGVPSGGSDGLAALRRMQGRLTAGLERGADGEELEQALAALRHAAPLGRSLRGLDRVRHHLGEVAGVLEARAVEDCTPTEARLSRRFREDYLRILQPRIAALDRSAAPLLEVLDEVFRQTREGLELPDEVDAYQRERLSPVAETGLWMRYRAALIRHARAWDPTLRVCGGLPGGDSAEF